MTDDPYQPASDAAPEAAVDARHEMVDSAVMKTELLLAYLLRTGVLTSILLVAIGLVITFIHHTKWMHAASPTTAAAWTHDLVAGLQGFPTTLGDTWTGLLHAQGRAFVVVGLLVLLITPVLRVTVSIIAFLFLKDRKFALITTIVLILLLVSFILGKAGG